MYIYIYIIHYITGITDITINNGGLPNLNNGIHWDVCAYIYIYTFIHTSNIKQR